MPAQIQHFSPKRQQETEEKLEKLQDVLDLFPELEERDCSSLIWKIKRKNKLNDPTTWTFIMISPEQNRAVVKWLNQNSKRRFEATDLWALLFEYVHRDTGQIMLSRLEIAEKTGIRHNNVTAIMSELEKIHAIIKKKDGRNVVYYMNPNIANHYPRDIREKSQKEAPKLKIIDGGLI